MEPISKRIYILLVILAFLAILGPIINIGYNEGIFYESAMIVAAFALLCLCLFFTSEKRNLIFEQRPWPLFFLFLFIIGGIISSLFAIVKYRSWSEFMLWLAGIVIFFVLSQIVNGKVLKKAAWFFVLFGFAVSIFGLFLYLYIKKPMFYRAYAPMLNPNVLAGYLIGIFPISLSLFFLEAKNKTKILVYLINIVIGILFILTISYTGWLSLLIVLAFGIYLFKDKIWNKRLLLNVLICILLIFFGAVIFRYLFGLSLKESLILHIPKGNEIASASHRFLYFKAGVKIFFDNFLTGVGLRNFTFPYLKMLESIKEVPTSTHNNYLDIALGTGIFGITGFVGFVVILFWKSISFLKKNKDIYFTGVFLGWLGMAINSGLDFNWEVKIIVINFWIFSGLLYGFWLQQNREKTIERKFSKPILALFAIVALSLFIKGLLIFLGTNYQVWAEKYQAMGDNREALSFYQRSWEFNNNPSVLIEIAQLHFDEAVLKNDPGAWQLAEETAKKVILEAPNQYFSYELLGRVYAAQKKFNEASEQYEKALQLNPRFSVDLNVEAVETYLELGKYQKAVQKVSNYLAIYDSQDYLSYYASLLASIPDKSKGNLEDQSLGVSKAIARLLEDQGKAYLALGDEEGAKESQQKAEQELEMNKESLKLLESAKQ